MDHVEFTKIVADTKRVVLASVARYLYPRFAHAIDDVVQETYVRAYRHLIEGKFRSEAALSTWLYSIARNEALRMNGKLHREEKKFHLKKTELHHEDTYQSQPIFDHSDIVELEGLIQTLPEKFKQVLQMVYTGASIQEISEALKLSAGTVKSRTSRGKEMVQRLYQEKFAEQTLGG